ncbi:TlpA family protein disulfide reductase [Cryobacterium tagatosivorans]|uniref:Thioredoxin n=1 Tax=Cryobacterium tagatosivorans TaxID=1259199 RepID=A0A4V3I6U8_9MICO|nr:thioredoxin family protein [Cryobacterium tagatosivorans]TFB56047.1 thioredoxin [Cryobacterium tagatosivorans]
MEPFTALVVILALVLSATALGLVWRAQQGRIAPVAGDVITPTDVASEVPFGRDATLLLFSTELCARCPGTSRLLAGVAGSRPGVAHLNVDLTHRADLANRYGVMQTPTTLILDGTGRVRARIGGVPHRAGIARHLDDLTGSSHVRLAS